MFSHFTARGRGTANRRRCASHGLLRALARERALADRTGGVFAFVLFDVSQQSSSARLRIGAAVVDRSRETDTVGEWVEEGIVGVVLNGCDSEGARLFAAAVRRMPSVRGLRFRCRIYSYTPTAVVEARHAGAAAGEEAAVTRADLAMFLSIGLTVQDGSEEAEPDEEIGQPQPDWQAGASAPSKRLFGRTGNFIHSAAGLVHRLPGIAWKSDPTRTVGVVQRGGLS